MKKFLMVLGILAVLIIIILFVVFQMTSGIVDVTDSFFVEVRNGNISEAYGIYLAEDFRAATSLEELEQFLEQTAIGNYEDASWSSRSMSGDQGELEGSIKTADGGTIPVKIELVKEKGEWKILSIYKSAAGILSDQAGPSIPDEATLRQMAGSSLLYLATAINAGDFTEFYQNIAPFWQNQTTAGELRNAFSSFIEQDIDLTVLEAYEAVFDEVPHIDENGVLKLVGHYPTQPSVAYFDLGYLYEDNEWQLSGINVNLK